ncbi:hypothetical protein H9657_05965 [Cellulomonas sp. Sa3CUA2]|uniref:Uncharacterized protein n=1 Tax=Cellulomonas avistercoris TaxID=2762242 RepID=A0ABR8QBL6_9CELL|nr:hypothetical protein [Cellulomonas avistercoris]MBD7917823.1 hypothetical protein [Cellulomonas avistercoris]
MTGLRTAAVASALALVAAGLAPAAWADAPAVPASPAPATCTDEVADETAAAALAAQCDREVEVLDARSEWATTYALPDGTMRLDTSIAAVRTDASGEWEPVDASVVEGDGGLVVASAVTPMVFSDGSAGQPLARIERDGHELTFDAPFDLPEPTVDGAQVTYAEVLPGVDLVLTVNEDATGFSEVLRVESPEAAAHPALAELTFDVETSDGIALQPTDGAFVAADGSGAPVFTSPVPTMWDSSTVASVPGWGGGPDRGVGPTADEVDPTVAPAPGAEVAAMVSEVDDDTVTITPDAELVADPATEWPVFIDPGISGSLHHYTAVRTAFGSAYNFAGDEGVGLCDRGATSTCPQTFRSRILWQFEGLQALGNLEPGDVLGAVFAATGTHSYSCTPMPVTLYAVANFDQSTVYPGGGYWQPLQTHNITHRAGCGAGKEPRRIEFDATWQAQAVASANTGNASFGMAADEGSMMSWKRYAWDASFSVTYNRPPAAAQNARTTAPYTACRTGAARPALRSVTPVLRAVLTDPDGGNLHGQFVVDDIATGARVWGSGWLPAQGTGSEQATAVPSGVLAGGRVYRWSVLGGDGITTGPAVACEFVTDLAPPVIPTVTPVADMPAVYAEDATRGGIGIEGRFTLDPGTSTDVAAFRYEVSGQQIRTVPATYRTIAVVPTTIGSHTLKVESIDKAGWASPARVYRFTVASAGVSDAWAFDEESGSTAANHTAANRPLTLTGAVSRVDGPRAGDRALQLAGGAATSTTPIVRTDGSYTVMATVRLDRVDRTATAVSQDGTTVSGFELGLRAEGDCPEGVGDSCWAFSTPASDTSSATVAVAASDKPAVAGEWVMLIAVRDVTAGTLQLAVCSLGDREAPFSEPPTVSSAASVGTPATLGAFRVGHGRAGGVPARHWPGAVAQVRTYTGVVSVERLRLTCSNPTAIVPELSPVPTPPPAPSPLPSPPAYYPGYAGSVHVMRGAAWYVNGPGDPSDATAVFGFGIGTDTPVVGDWNGDGVDTVGIFRGSEWSLNDGNDGSAPERVFNYGVASDRPVVGDWNGDGVDTVGIFRGGVWNLNDQNDGSAPERVFTYGNTGDIPVFGDWNGDGVDTVGVFRGGWWYLNDQNDSSAPEHVFGYGNADDVPVAGDWNRDGIDTVGVFRQGSWHLNDENDGSAPEYAFLFGAPGDIPARGSGLRR